MRFPQVTWATIGSVADDGALVYAAVVGSAAGGCVLLTLVSRVQRHCRGRASLTR